MFNLFIHRPNSLGTLALISQPSAYDASAIANAAVDAGYAVEADLWSATVPDAMLRPEMYKVLVEAIPDIERPFTLRWDASYGSRSRRLSWREVERVGHLVSQLADKGEVWDIAVVDLQGEDVTFEFACFQD
ncbi:hypothetical protein [Streptomyces sp. SM8]|uniref:hypothetical protein n=1 Tax=Streptomyces sp. SM8 TaxID=1195457 RepID=UPI0002831134|nr:hypothetical protein [Streptomyces sp. SM8]PKA37942.1 hypothetical protein SM8_029425 [Streptomyces sp. SM8]